MLKLILCFKGFILLCDNRWVDSTSTEQFSTPSAFHLNYIHIVHSTYVVKLLKTQYISRYCPQQKMCIQISCYICLKHRMRTT